ncbi:hypothetical protein EC991_006916 [Linnemannia zychae]|nr:hypothetical protein EC991_006916 [Linnemannia zychae]
MSQQQPTTATVTYVGCFKEDIRSPDLDGEPPLSITRAEACFTHCSIGTWSFAGIRNGTICTCGDSDQRKYGSAPESSCSTKCPENQSAFDDCGGTEANSVYFVGAMTPKVPWPTPSVINPTAILPSITPPSSDDGNGNGGDRNNVLGNTKHSSTAVIASVAAVAGIAVLTIATLLVHRRKKGRRSMSSMEDGTGSSRFGRHDSKDRGTNAAAGGGIDPYSRARTGHSWFVSGHRDLDLDDIESIDDDENQSEDSTGHRKGYLSRSGSRKKEHHDLFEGFESSAMDEDHSSSQSIHPSSEHRSIEAAPNTLILPADGPIVPRNESATATPTETSDLPSASSSVSSTTTAFPLGQPSKTSFATKIGLKMGHLKVKVPTPNTSITPADNSSVTIPHVPISPISPISPTSRSSSASSTTAPAFNNHSTAATATGYLDIDAGPASHYSERSPTSATPSFSFASAPVPGQASNQQEAKKVNNHGNKHHYHDPPSPISPQKPTIPSPASLRQPSTTYPQKSSQSGNSRHQKKHRSDLIKDLILQGDSALEDKELALMAQYQPHHCWQQQQQHVTQQAAVTAAATSAPSKAVARRASLEPTDKSSTNANQASSAPALIIPSPRDYLAPPPRILVHKAL